MALQDFPIYNSQLSSCDTYCDESNGSLKLRKRPSFVIVSETGNAPAAPTTPANPPTGEPGISHGGIYEESWADKSLFWQYDCLNTAWTLAKSQNKAASHHVICLSSTDIPALPITTPNAASMALVSTPVEGDILQEEYFNGYITWKYVGGAWVYQCGRDFGSGPVASPNK